jgi:hypothetical protein
VTTGEMLREQLVRDNGIDPARSTPCRPASIRARSRRAIDTPRPRALNLPDSTALVGIVATLRSWKGHRVLLDAFRKLRRAEVRLVIVGDGPQRAALEAQTDALGLRAPTRVMFAGQQHDVAPWLAAFDVFALPSTANEGVPQALLQAMFMGVPCVTTDAGAIPEIARDGETALVVPREDSSALAAALDRLLLVPSIAAGLSSARASIVLPRFALPTMLDRMENVFQRAPDREPAARVSSGTRANRQRSPATPRSRSRTRDRSSCARSRSAARGASAPRAAARADRASPAARRHADADAAHQEAARAPSGADIAMTVPRAFAPLYAAHPYGVRALGVGPAPSVAASVRRAGVRRRVRAGRQPLRWLAAAMKARWIVAFAGERP